MADDISDKIKKAEHDKYLAEIKKVEAETYLIEINTKEQLKTLAKPWYKKESFYRIFTSLLLGGGVLAFYITYIIRPAWEKDTIAAELKNERFAKALAKDSTELQIKGKRIANDSVELQRMKKLISSSLNELQSRTIEYQNKYKIAADQFASRLDSVTKLSNTSQKNNTKVDAIIKRTKTSISNLGDISNRLFKYNLNKFVTQYGDSFFPVNGDLRNRFGQILGFVEKYSPTASNQQIAYVLATIKYETANTFLPMAEIGKGAGRPYGQKLKMSQESGQHIPYNTPDKLYYGRGYVQLVWYENYELMGKVLGIDLLKYPDLALDPEIAYRIVTTAMFGGLFTGKQLNKYINDTQTDYVNARSTINAHDHDQQIAEDAKKFETILTNSLTNAR
ncbi:glycoside hydrolase family 19 protein [Mucilaginibacter angelicae]|uniref:Glycoside hydrolase family 19 protein n=1 Tax=Mucilaginibacter angelicae TaxID=869718 RepID=A0ABV6LE27_9SPHI